MFGDKTKMHGCQSDLHIIIHGRGLQLSFLRLTRYKQSVQSRERHRTLRKWLVESCWSNQNQEMEIESLQIQIILSTKPRKQTVEKIHSCLPYIVWIYQTDFVLFFFFSSLSLSVASWSNEWISCFFFVLYAFVLFLLWGYKGSNLKKVLLYRNRKCCLFLFVSLWLQFLSVWKPAWSTPNIGPFWGTDIPPFGSKIHNVANSGGSFSSTKGAWVILFCPKPPERWDTVAGGWVLRQNVCKFKIVRSEPESNWNFTFLFSIFTFMNFLVFALSNSTNLVSLMLLENLFSDRQCDPLCPTHLHMSHFFFLKVHSLYQCSASHTEEGLGSNFSCLFSDLLGEFVWFDLFLLVGDLVCFL